MSDILITLKTIVDQALADLKKASGAVDEVGKTARDSGDGVDKFSTAMLGLNQALEVFNKVLQAAQKVHDETVGVYLEYAEQVRDMARATGEGSESASRLIQMADDVGVSYDKLKTSLQMAARQGIDVGVESMKAMSEEYLTLAPGTERMQFLLTNFGRSGAEMGRLLELGAAGLEKLNEGVEDGLILSDVLLKQARRHEILVDTYNDLIGQKKIAVGATMSEVESYFMLEGMINTQLAVMQAEQEATTGVGMTYQESAIFMSMYHDEAEKIVQTSIDQKIAHEENSGAVRGLEAAQENYAAALQDVATAQAQLENIQRSWLDSTANEMVSALNAMKVEGDGYMEALGVIDDVLETDKQGEEEHAERIRGIAGAYAETGSLDDFRMALQGLREDEYPQTTAALETFRAKAQELNEQLNKIQEIAEKPIVITIDFTGKNWWILEEMNVGG